MTEKENYTQPIKEGYTIYTKSGCPNCTKVKALLTGEPQLIVDCDDYIIEDKISFLEFIKEKSEKEWKTFPMVFHNENFIGGFAEIAKYKEQLDAFSTTTDF